MPAGSELARVGMVKAISRTARRNLIGLLWLGLALRVLIPVGYMPAPFSEGGPIVLCPDGLPAGLFAAMDDRLSVRHHAGSANGAHGHDTSADQPNPWDSCEFGGTPGVFLPVSDYLVPLSEPGHERPESNPQGVVPVLFTSSYQARAPPTAQLLEG